MIKKRKKMLFAFIVLIIAVLLFSVIWVITVYLSWPTQQQAAYQQALEQAALQDSLNLSGGSITITTGSWEVLTWEVQ